MSKLKSREEIEEIYKWDLSSLYENDELWEKSYVNVQSAIKDIQEYKGNLFDSSNVFKQAIELELELSRNVSRLFTYAKMKQDENTQIADYQAMTARAESLSFEVEEATAFMTTELLANEYSVIEEYMNEDPELKLYEKYFKDLFKKKVHILSESEEKLLAQMGEVGSVAQNAFGMLNNADLKFPIVEDSNGEKIQLSHGNFVPTLESSDRLLRKNAFEAYYKVYEDHKNVYAAMLSGNVKKDIFYSKARRFDTARQAALFENDIPESVYDHLIEAVHKKLPAMHKYMDIRKRALKVEELHMYDIYTPIVENTKIEVSYEDAKDLALKALKPLGDRYIDVVEKSFSDKWIDVYENKGKRSGAYSWGSYDSKPYMLLNYHNTLDNAFTLVHEMGHSLHSYLTRKNQPYVYGNYSIFVAEVASTTNEALLNHYLIKNEENPKKKLFILNHYLEQFRGTIYRQTMFAEFERDIHTMVENGEALTEELLSNHYIELNKKYYGNEMISDELIRLEWARIPHFYYNFYVYQYATGFSAAIALSQRIIEEGEAAVADYLEFLKAGSSQSPIDILKKAGADMLSSEPVENALNLFSDLVDEFERLLFQ
jgi:oligoendopeptidase F